MGFQRGEIIKIGNVKTEILGFEREGNTWEAVTEYGNFNLTLIKKIDE